MHTHPGMEQAHCSKQPKPETMDCQEITSKCASPQEWLKKEKKKYIRKYKQTATDIQQWCAVQTPNEYTEAAIKNWKLTGDKLLDDRDFNYQRDWPLAAFLP